MAQIQTHEEQLPASVDEARATMSRFTRELILRLSVLFAGVGAFAGGAAFFPQVVDTPPAVMLFLAFVFIGAILMVRSSMKQAIELERAKAILAAWNSREVARLGDASQAPVAADPTDDRWPAVCTLLGRVRELGASQAGLLVGVAELETRLRGMFLDLERLQEARQADEALSLVSGAGGQPTGDPHQERLRAAIAARSGQVERLLALARDLHVQLAVQEDRDVEALARRLDDLRALLRAEAEVDGRSEPASAGMVGARAAPGAAAEEASRLQAARQAAQRQGGGIKPV